MANTYYDSELTAEEIEEVLEAINGILTPANNGKVLAISNGKFEARSVQWGGDSTLEPLSVTANGDYYPEAGVDGFDEVHVSVPNSYTASDEGKVVNNGALIAQTARTTQITENGTYDTTLNDEVTVDVSGGGSAVVQPLSVTQNGIYNPPSGVDGYAPVTVNVSGGGSDVIVSQTPPSSDVGTEGQYYIYEEQLLSVKYGIQIITAARNTDYSFRYWGARDIDFVFTDGNTDYHLRDFSNAHCYWASGNSGAFTLQDSNIAGQTGSYKEHDGLPGWYEIEATIPVGLLLSKVRICGRNDGWGDFWRTFKIGQWIDRRNFLNTLINEQDLVLSDWNTSPTSAYTEFTLSSPMTPIGSIIPHLYRKLNGVWVQYC